MVSEYIVSSDIQQAEQLNGYVLLNFKIETPAEIETFINQRFCFQGLNDFELTLFQMPSSATGNYSFLSQQPLTAEFLNEGNEKRLISQFSNPSFELPENNQPLVIVAEQPFLANAFAIAKVRHQQKAAATVIFIEAESFPFMLKPARFWAPEVPDEAIGASALLEDWGIMNRMASSNAVPGCFDGSLQALFDEWVTNSTNLDGWQLAVLSDSAQASKYQSIFERH